KDLALFGGFGVRGVGYDVARLAQQLTSLLHLEQIQRIVIVGMGNIGTALARSPAFNSGTFRVVAGFDADPLKVGREIGPVRILPMEDLTSVVEATGARLAVLAVPADAAVPVFRAIAAAGIPAV